MTASQYLETVTLPLDDLTPFPGNAWHGDADRIAESITENGQYRPLVVRRMDDGSHVVLAGNHTLAALKLLGRDSSLCGVLSCSDETAVKINLADNKLPAYGSYDDSALMELLKTVGDDFTGTGYDPDELDDLVARLEPGEMVLPTPGPTGARFAESDEEEAARRERVEAYEPRHSSAGDGAMTELILVMKVADRQEASTLIGKIRKRDGDLTAGEIVLYALRVHADEETEDAA